MGLSYEDALRLSPELAAQHPDAPAQQRERSQDLQREIRKSKYGAVRSRYRGIRCDSKAEQRHFELLDADPTVAWWLDHPRFHLTKHDTYEADALVFYKSPISYDLWAVEAHDVKGYRTRRFKHMCNLWEEYGPCPLVIIHRGKRDEVIICPHEQRYL